MRAHKTTLRDARKAVAQTVHDHLEDILDEIRVRDPEEYDRLLNQPINVDGLLSRGKLRPVSECGTILWAQILNGLMYRIGQPDLFRLGDTHEPEDFSMFNEPGDSMQLGLFNQEDAP